METCRTPELALRRWRCTGGAPVDFHAREVWHGAPVWFIDGEWDYKNIVKRPGVLEKIGDW